MSTSNFTLRRESCEEVVDFNVLITSYENDAEQRRLKNSNPVIGFNITSPIMDYATLQTYRAFVISNYGARDTFKFTSPFNKIEYDVRFEPGSFKTVFRAGVFQSTFRFKVVH